jgi:hypothetical protein
VKENYSQKAASYKDLANRLGKSLAGRIYQERSLKCCTCGRHSTSQSKPRQEESMICISSHPHIRQRAYEIFQERLQTGRKGDARSDWIEAEHESRRHRIPAQASMLHLHPRLTTLFR